ncbi:unnamed protein product, partial [Effrenium voratum]
MARFFKLNSFQGVDCVTGKAPDATAVPKSSCTVLEAVRFGSSVLSGNASWADMCMEDPCAAPQSAEVHGKEVAPLDTTILNPEDLPCFITATSPCFLWSSTTSWQIQSLVVLGDVFSVCGPIQVVNGFLMIPVEAGAVELGYFEGARRADLEVPCPIVDVSRKRRCGTSLV